MAIRGNDKRTGEIASPMQSATPNIAAAHIAVLRVYDDAGNVIETHEHMGDFKEW